MTESILERKGLFPLALSGNSLLLREDTAGTWRQEQKQGPWRNIAYWLASHGLLSLFSYTPQDHLTRGDTTHSGLVLSTSIRNLKKKGTQAHIIEAFSQLRLCTLK